MVVVVPGSYSPPSSLGSSAFADFLDLRTAVIEHVQRPDIADVFPRLVVLAESRLNRSLRLREQITSGTVTLTSGTASLPSNYAEMIGLYDANGAEYLQESPQNKNACWYSVQGGNIVAPNISGVRTIDYYAVIPTLSDTVTATNWLLSGYPDVYLYSVAFEAAKYVRDIELAAQTKVLMDDAISTAKSEDEAARYSRGRVRVAGCTP